MTYTPPLNDILFVLTRLIGLDKIAALPGYDSVSDDLTRSILEEAGKLAAGTFAPLNHNGDKQGLKFSNNAVTMPDGFVAAYKEYVDGGWNGLSFSEEIGGQGLPATLAMPVQEMLQTANLSLALCTLLNQGAIELLHRHGTESQKKTYLPNMVSGAWSGTMNLTEPQAGSDVGAVRCKAMKDGQHYKVTGQKIYISYGEHDMTENIIHLVLARLPDAPEGTKGLSLFLVPKFLVNADGTLGARNDAYAISIEHKLGQHASPTCTMAYGEKGGAYAELVGEENRGIEAMFVMMNNARIGVGIQGLALCERAMQHAANFARSRVQSKPLKKGADKPVTIIQHPDVRRMLMLMKSQTEAARALAYSAAFAIDAKHQERVDLLTPIVKAWITDLSNELTSLSVQVFGGMGFVEETGAAQHMRDARVLAIYEGTNGIQANDLVFRKLARDDGKAFNEYLAEMRDIAKLIGNATGDDALQIAGNLNRSLGHLEQAAKHLLTMAKIDMNATAFAAAPFLRLFAITAGGARLAESAYIANQELKSPNGFSADFLESKIITARFYAESILPQTAGLLPTILANQNGVMAMPENWF
ncbi:MAG: acyl-CoA dehydrogenase [Alphaproteobacteria bacterium]|nr:acyl-CoA dehydrogenase [Alphaproteobacteria bacterium]